MDISVKNQVVILLTVWFGSVGKSDPKPLTSSEWHSFSLWLKEKDRCPETLLMNEDISQYLEGWDNKNITTDRIKSLLARAGASGLSLERWHRAGLWVMTCFDKDYPSYLKNRVAYMPPVLFGCGNCRLLNNGGIAVIGSRDVTQEELNYTKRLGSEIVSQGYSVISGGARGVDDAAMSGAMEKEGTVVGVLSDNLMRAATSSKYRKALIAGDLVLISSFNPEAGFDVGNAMARNKYIYCLSDAAIVIASSKEKGGTWSGAVENLSNKWVPLWVKSTTDNKSGNKHLIAKGGHWLPDNNLSVASLIIPDSAIQSLTYSSFLSRWEKSGMKGAIKKDDLREMFDIGKKCLNQWLKQGVSEGKIMKHTKPVQYQLVQENQLTLDLDDFK